MRTLLTVPGIHSDGDKNVDLLGRELAAALNYRHEEVVLPRRWAISCYRDSVQTDDAHTLMDAYQAGDCVIGHSRAALVILRAMEIGCMFHTVILFAPAAPSDCHIEKGGCVDLIVIYNPHDKALLAARAMLWHPFKGRRFRSRLLGRVGYEGPEDWVTNIEAAPVAREWVDHSNFALEPNRGQWLRRCAAWLPPK